MNRFRVVFLPALEIPGVTTHISSEYPTYDLATIVRNEIAIYTLGLHDCGLMPDYSNTAWIEHYFDGEWIEFDEDEQCQD